jgi:hypothetical protein
MSITGFATDGTQQITYLRSVYATELSFVGLSGSAFSILNGSPTFRYLLITGTGQDKMGGFYLRSSAVSIDGVAIWGMTIGYTMFASQLFGASSLSIVCSFCGAAIEAVSSYIHIANTGWFMATSCTAYGCQLTSCFASLGKYYAAGIQQGAAGLAPLMIREGSQVELWAGSDIYFNNSNGIVFLAPGTLVHQGIVSIRNNTVRGIEMTGGYAWIEQTHFSNNAQGSIWAHDYAYARAIGSVLDALPQPIAPFANTYNTQNGSFIFL